MHTLKKILSDGIQNHAALIKLLLYALTIPQESARRLCSIWATLLTVHKRPLYLIKSFDFVLQYKRNVMWLLHGHPCRHHDLHLQKKARSVLAVSMQAESWSPAELRRRTVVSSLPGHRWKFILWQYLHLFRLELASHHYSYLKFSWATLKRCLMHDSDGGPPSQSSWSLPPQQIWLQRSRPWWHPPQAGRDESWPPLPASQ